MTVRSQEEGATANGAFGKGLRVLLFVFFGIMIVTFVVFLPTYLYFLMTRSDSAVSIATNPITGVFIGFFLSTFIVLFLKYSSGPIEFEGLTFRFKGASGPVVLWALVFIVIVIGLSTLGAAE
jgi:hypothetical protein